MFIGILNESQQASLLNLAREIAEVDGVLHDNEITILENLKQQISPKATEIKTGELPDEFDTHQSKIALLLELIGIAFADSDYQSKEKQIIDRAAQSLGISQDLVTKLEDWVSRQLSLVREAYEIMEK